MSLIHSNNNMTKQKQQPPPHPRKKKNITRAVSLVIRLILIFGLLPPDWNDWIYNSHHNEALGSIVALPTFTIAHVREAAALRRLAFHHAPDKQQQQQSQVENKRQHMIFADAYQGGRGRRRGGGMLLLIHLPPLLLAAMEALLRLVTVAGSAFASVGGLLSKDFCESVIVGILLLFVDFWISRLLENIVTLALGLSSSSSSSSSGDPNKNEDNNNNNNNSNNNSSKDDWAWEQGLQAIMPELIRPKFAHVFAIEHHHNDETVVVAVSTNENTGGREEANHHHHPTVTVSSSSTSTTAVISQEHLPGLVANLYFASPVTMLASSVFACFQNLRTLLLLLALCETMKAPPPRKSAGRVHVVSTTALALALATYMDITFVVFVIPLALCLWQRCHRRGHQQKAAAVIFFFVFWTVSLLCLHVMAFLLIHGGSNNNNNHPHRCNDYFAILQSTTLHALSLEKLTPSLSIFWYTQMQLFGRFATYFQIIFALLPFMLIIPTAIRLHRYPIVLVANFWLVWTLFRPTGTLYDLNVGLCLMLISPQSMARMNIIPLSLIATCALVVPVCLYIVLYWMWLETGNGEANFLYFQCYAYNVFVAILFIQFTGASVERDKALRLTIMKEKQKSTSATAAGTNESQDVSG